MGRQKEPKTPAQLYNLFHAGDAQLSGWLSALTGEQDELVLGALHAALAEPVVIFERIFARYYVRYLAAEEGSFEEDFWYAVTRMLGYEYENYYRSDPKFLMESAAQSAAADVTAVEQGRYYSPSDPATLTPTQRKPMYSLPRWDPRGTIFDKKTAASFAHRVSAYCDSCDDTEQHDVWKVLLNGGAGMFVMFGKNSTAGKIGKRTMVRICARCGRAAASE